MKGHARKQVARSAAAQWQQLRFASLKDKLSAPHLGELRLPLFAAPSLECSQAAEWVLRLASSDAALNERCELEHFPFFSSSTSKPPGSSPLLLGERDISVVNGLPSGLGSPRSMELEIGNWLEGFMRSEEQAFNDYHALGALKRGANYLHHTKWFDQLLLDGNVSQRVEAHRGESTASMFATQRQASRFGSRVPPFSQSPYYASDDSMSSWCLFGDLSSSSPAKDGLETSHQLSAQMQGLLQVALASAVLPAFHGVWLNAAVVTHRHSGVSVLILGPRESGKTTLALHCLGASPDVMLTASEEVFLASGTSIGAMLGAKKTGGLFFSSVPSTVPVRLGAVLGSLHPNPFLAQHIQPFPSDSAAQSTVAALLRNTEGALWNMSKEFRVHIAEAFPSPQRWRPTTLGPLGGIIMLNWDVDQLFHPSQTTTIRGGVRQFPLPSGQALDCLHNLQVSGGKGSLPVITRNHHLIKNVVDRDGGWERLVGALVEECDGAPSPAMVHELVGSVNFEAAAGLILRLLSPG